RRPQSRPQTEGLNGGLVEQPTKFLHPLPYTVILVQPFSRECEAQTGTARVCSLTPSETANLCSRSHSPRGNRVSLPSASLRSSGTLGTQHLSAQLLDSLHPCTRIHHEPRAEWRASGQLQSLRMRS